MRKIKIKTKVIKCQIRQAISKWSILLADYVTWTTLQIALLSANLTLIYTKHLVRCHVNAFYDYMISGYV